MKVEYLFDPFEIAGVDPESLPASVRRDVLAEVSDYVLESVLLDVADTRSPVTGRPFKGLSKDYKERKEAEGGTPIANLLMDGDLLDALTVKKAGKTALALTVSEDQQPKADGHNNFSGDSKLPRRPFIPDAKRDESFRPAIREGIRDIVLEALSDAEAGLTDRPESAVVRR